MKHLFLLIVFLSLILPQQVFAVNLQSNYHAAKIELEFIQYFTKDMFHCYDIEELCKQSPQEARDKVTVIVTDPDANKFNASIDRIKVQALSDTDQKGIIFTAYETHVNSGVFEGTVLIESSKSVQNKVHVSEGDTLTAKYVDTTLPMEYKSNSLEVTATSFIGLLGVPIERVPTFGLMVLDKKMQVVSSIYADQQVQIVANMTNQYQTKQPFSFIMQILDERGTVQYLSWINGTLNPKQSLRPAISWTPQDHGHYDIGVFVWESIQNPTALSPPLNTSVEVLPNK